MKKVVTIKDADSNLVVSFTCPDSCDTCCFRFNCFTDRTDFMDLWCIDVDLQLRRMPREIVRELVDEGLPDDEFYLRAFKLVAKAA